MKRLTIHTTIILALALGLVLDWIVHLNRETEMNLPLVPQGVSAASPIPEHLPSTDVQSDWWTAAQENIRQSEYHVTWQDFTYLPDVSAAYHAPNRAHNLRTYFTPHGPVIVPRVWPEEAEAPPWRWEVKLVAWGRGEGKRTDLPLQAIGDATLHPDANRVEYHRGSGHGDTLTEWYINGEQGLDQGFTLASPPSASRSPGSLVLKLTLTGNLSPGLIGDGVVELSAPNGDRVLRYGTLRAADAAGKTLPAQMRLSGCDQVPSLAACSLVLSIDDAAAFYPITIGSTLTALSPAGLSLSPDWTADGDQTSAAFGISVRTAGDVNGDGYSDVIVGAPYYDGGQDDEGWAFVYHGSASGLSPDPDWMDEGDQDGALFGTSAGMAGDINDDGYTDIIVGAPGYDGGDTDEGRFYIYHGSPSGLSDSPNTARESNRPNAHLGRSVGMAGDVNGDGYSDVIAGAHHYGSTEGGRVYVYHGSVSGLALTTPWMVDCGGEGAHCGESVSTAGDVNGDGYADVIVGAPDLDYHSSEDSGRALVYYGSASGLSTVHDWQYAGGQEGAHLGRSVSTAGDVNGDGYSDVIVGADYYDGSFTDEGRAYVYHGSSAGLSTTPNWTTYGYRDNAYFGHAVSAAGDVNGDGYSDVIVGADGYGNGQTLEGVVFVYYGSESGLNPSFGWMAESNQAGARFGRAVGMAGDVNGDGYADVIIGAPLYVNGQAEEGQAFVYHGSPDGLNTTAGWMDEGDREAAQYGHSVSTAGDVNGDGYSDVIVGAPDYDNGHNSEGAAFVYHGSASGLSAAPNWIVESDQDYAHLGHSVSVAGDVNGDGYSDVIVGAPNYDNGQSGEGGAFVYHGSVSGLSATPNWIAESDQLYAEFGCAVSTAGDVNGDGYGDVIVGAHLYSNGHAYEGGVFVYHGSVSGLSATPNWTAESDQGYAEFGYAVSTAGDVNGDGFSDVIVGAPDYDDGQEDEGGAFVYLGSPVGLATGPAGWVTDGDQAGARYGQSVGTAGDVNGDGYADVVVGAPSFNGYYGIDAGQAYVYRGSETGLSTAHSWMEAGSQAEAFFGTSVSTAGDVNGDGYADIIVGAPEYDDDQDGEGRAFAYHGGASGLSSTADWTVDGDSLGAKLGHSVSTAGDVNGDAYADVVVGAPRYDNGQVDEGRAFVYYGNRGPGLAMWPRQRQVGMTPLAPLGLVAYDEWVQLCLMRRTPMGREKVIVEWQIAPRGTLFTDTVSSDVITGTTGAWFDSGSLFCQNINVPPRGSLHWRIRLRYHPSNALGQPASRWMHVPWNGWNEADFRTPFHHVYMPLVLR
jgi:hypothetical protein